MNVLVNAFREDATHHRACKVRLERLLASEEVVGIAEAVIVGFVRIATHMGVFHPPSTRRAAFGFVEALLSHPNCHRVIPGVQHWNLFRNLCEKADARGTLVMDAWLAAIALETGSEVVTLDRDFSRFPGVKTSLP